MMNVMNDGCSGVVVAVDGVVVVVVVVVLVLVVVVVVVALSLSVSLLFGGSGRRL